MPTEGDDDEPVVRRVPRDPVRRPEHAVGHDERRAARHLVQLVAPRVGHVHRAARIGRHVVEEAAIESGEVHVRQLLPGLAVRAAHRVRIGHP